LKHNIVLIIDPHTLATTFVRSVINRLNWVTNKFL